MLDTARLDVPKGPPRLESLGLESLDGAATTTPRWFGPSTRPLLGWLTTPRDELAAARPAAVICPPLGYEYWCAHHALRQLSESLAVSGWTALRLDYDGTGDSAGEIWDPDRLGHWRASIRHAADELRRLGSGRLALVGLRAGAAMAAAEAAAAGADDLVCWAPVVSGRRYRRELELLGTPVPEGDPRPGTANGLVVAGFAFPAEALAGLAGLGPASLTGRPAERALVIDRPERLDGSQLVKRLRELGVRVEHVVEGGTERFLDVPAEDGQVPFDLLERVRGFLAGAPGRLETPPAAPAIGAGPGPLELAAPELAAPELARRRLAWRGGACIESVVTLGRQPYACVLSEPLTGPAKTTVVFLNSGSEPHVGPGRAWVEYARDLACRGIAAARVDFPGWGETPGPCGRPYDEVCLGATLEIVAALRALRQTRIVLAGLCAGAWIALRAVLEEPVSGVVAINPQLYYERGDPVEALLSDTRSRRTAQRQREERGRRSGWWTLLDLFGARNAQGRWLDALAGVPTRVLWCFAEGDDGLEYLRNRLARRFAAGLASGGFELAEIPAIDHAMHLEWLRPAVSEQIAAFASSFGDPCASSFGDP